jgi:hypothetical protein
VICHPPGKSAKQQIHSHRGNSEKAPCRGVGDAYLTVYIHRHSGIVPDAKPELNVDNQPAKKFKQRDDPRTKKHLLCKNGVKKGSADTSNAQKAQPSEKKHADMCISAKQNFNKAI